MNLAARSPRPKTFAAQPHKTKPPESIRRFFISQRRARLAEGVTRQSDSDITNGNQRGSQPAHGLRITRLKSLTPLKQNEISNR
jgi:hypothetical protein